MLPRTFVDLFENIPSRKQRCPKKRTQQVNVVADAVFFSPAHPHKQMKRLCNMSKNNQEQAACTNQLQDGSHGFGFKEENG